MRDGPNLSRTVTVYRKATKRTLPWNLTAGELDLVSSRPQVVDMRATKKQRIEEPVFFASTDEAARKTASTDVSVGLPPPVADNHDDAHIDPVMDTQPNSRVTGRRTIDEDAKLTNAVANTSRRSGARSTRQIGMLLPRGRTTVPCLHRWKDVLDPNIDQTTGRTGKWTAVEDSKLKDAVQTHGDKDWDAIAALFPDRSRNQCRNRWKHVLVWLFTLEARGKTKSRRRRPFTFQGPDRNDRLLIWRTSKSTNTALCPSASSSNT
jgi:hypothetical protein